MNAFSSSTQHHHNQAGWLIKLGALLALLALLSPYLISGVVKLWYWQATLDEVSDLTGLTSDFAIKLLAAATICLQLGASIWLLSALRGSWLAALALAGFTLAASLLAHNWWAMPGGPARSHSFASFWEHLALIGALIQLSIWRYQSEQE